MALLQYSDTNYKQGIIQAEEDYCELGDGGISDNDLLLKQFTRHNNNAMSTIWNWIFQGLGGKYEDSNQSNLPASAQDLVNTTSKYALPTDALDVIGIEVLDTNGNWRKLYPTNEKRIQRDGTLGQFGTQSGYPTKYLWKGDTIMLDFIPKDNVTKGFKVFYGRGSVSFVPGDTTKKPGFIAEFHNAVPTLASIDYLKVHKPQSSVLVTLIKDAAQFQIDIPKFYATRNQNAKPPRVTPFFNPQGYM